MHSLKRLINEDKFLRTMFGALPCGIVVVDETMHVQAINHPLERVLGISINDVRGKGLGEALKCIYEEGSLKGCGFSDYCDDCELRKAALVAFEKNQKCRTKAQLRIEMHGKLTDLFLVISASPFQYGGEKFVVILFEDIAKLRSLQPKDSKEGFWGIVSDDAKMLELFDLIRNVAANNFPVLIQGETGTGKEMIAVAIHNEGLRAKNRFVPVHCAALPKGLLESELFGQVEGAFPGAARSKKGRFELADDGTIFLDEIGELTPAMQVKLLRVLQEGRFESLGSEESVSVDVRVISASNKNLEAEVMGGRFREDLYYRLCVVPFYVPLLRERRNDIPLLAEHFLTRIARESGRGKASLSPETLSLLGHHTWPGNIRELQNVIQYALIRCTEGEIRPEHLPPAFSLRGEKAIADIIVDREIINEKTLAEALEKAKGNRVKAAKLLGVSRATLYRYITKLKGKGTDF